MYPVKVLMLLGEPISSGGQEKFLLNMLHNIDRSRVVFDVFSPFGIENENTAKEFESLGSAVFAAGLSFTHNKNKNFKKAVKQFFKTHKYNIVHIHSGSTFALMKGSEIARKSGAKRVIVHSHCGGFVDLRYKIIHFISFLPLLHYPTDYFACSELAAKWKFPKPIINRHKYTVIKNAVDLKTFHFNEALRRQTRKELSTEDNLVLGHVGRFALQKNHSFLLDIFAEVLKLRNDARLVLAGDGETLDDTLLKAEKLGIRDKILYLGLRHDISALMNAFDLFILPSFFEGLPIVGVEAQATGLPVIASSGVTKELPIGSLAEYIPLSESAKLWAEKIVAASDYTRRDTCEEIKAAGYEITSAAAALQKKYEEMN